jgi:hypothetical protein
LTQVAARAPFPGGAGAAGKLFQVLAAEAVEA